MRDLCEKLAVDAPICTATAEVLAGRWSVDEAIDALLTRPIRLEAD